VTASRDEQETRGHRRDMISVVLYDNMLVLCSTSAASLCDTTSTVFTRKTTLAMNTNSAYTLCVSTASSTATSLL
jgi:hypothetical protein